VTFSMGDPYAGLDEPTVDPIWGHVSDKDD
jgi:hypothetical protein